MQQDSWRVRGVVRGSGSCSARWCAGEGAHLANAVCPQIGNLEEGEHVRVEIEACRRGDGQTSRGALGLLQCGRHRLLHHRRRLRSRLLRSRLLLRLRRLLERCRRTSASRGDLYALRATRSRGRLRWRRLRSQQIVAPIVRARLMPLRLAHLRRQRTAHQPVDHYVLLVRDALVSTEPQRVPELAARPCDCTRAKQIESALHGLRVVKPPVALEVSAGQS